MRHTYVPQFSQPSSLSFLLFPATVCLYYANTHRVFPRDTQFFKNESRGNSKEARDHIQAPTAHAALFLILLPRISRHSSPQYHRHAISLRSPLHFGPDSFLIWNSLICPALITYINSNHGADEIQSPSQSLLWPSPLSIPLHPRALDELITILFCLLIASCYYSIFLAGT